MYVLSAYGGPSIMKPRILPFIQNQYHLLCCGASCVATENAAHIADWNQVAAQVDDTEKPGRPMGYRCEGHHRDDLAPDPCTYQ